VKVFLKLPLSLYKVRVRQSHVYMVMVVVVSLAVFNQNGTTITVTASTLYPAKTAVNQLVLVRPPVLKKLIGLTGLVFSVLHA